MNVFVSVPRTGNKIFHIIFHIYAKCYICAKTSSQLGTSRYHWYLGIICGIFSAAEEYFPKPTTTRQLSQTSANFSNRCAFARRKQRNLCPLHPLHVGRGKIIPSFTTQPRFVFRGCERTFELINTWYPFTKDVF